MVLKLRILESHALGNGLYIRSGYGIQSGLSFGVIERHLELSEVHMDVMPWSARWEILPMGTTSRKQPSAPFPDHRLSGDSRQP